jgi:hypothetical protein
VAPEADWKVAPVSEDSVLVGHPDAVDQALQRIAVNGPQPELAQLAEERQAGSEFWASGSAGMFGLEAVNAGVMRFSFMVSIRNGFTSDLAFEFNEAPGANALPAWLTGFGDAATVQGNAVHAGMAIEADDLRRQLPFQVRDAAPRPVPCARLNP